MLLTASTVLSDSGIMNAMSPELFSASAWSDNAPFYVKSDSAAFPSNFKLRGKNKMAASICAHEVPINNLHIFDVADSHGRIENKQDVS